MGRVSVATVIKKPATAVIKKPSTAHKIKPDKSQIKEHPATEHQPVIKKPATKRPAVKNIHDEDDEIKQTNKQKINKYVFTNGLIIRFVCV